MLCYRRLAVSYVALACIPTSRVIVVLNGIGALTGIGK